MSACPHLCKGLAVLVGIVIAGYLINALATWIHTSRKHRAWRRRYND